MKNLCVKTFFVLLLLLLTDLIALNGVTYRFILTKIGVAEIFQLCGMFALLGVYIAGEIYCAFAHYRDTKKKSVH